MMKKISVKTLTRCGMIAALYTVISIAFLPLGFGAVQARVSEALTLLPVLTPDGIWGVTLGCLITNTCGVAMGANILGAADVLFGTAATLSAALLTRALRGVCVRGLPVASAIPPVVINAVVVGAELTYAETGHVFSSPLIWINMVQVGLGQAFSCVVLGLILVWALRRTGLDRRLFEDE